MATTVNGGAYKRGETWVNADGVAIEDKAVIAEAERLSSEREQALDAQERDLVRQTAMRDPFTRQLLIQQQAAAPKAAPKAEK